MNQSNFDEKSIIPSILKVTASEDVDIQQDLIISDNNQKTIAELIDEKTQEEINTEEKKTRSENKN